MHKSNNILDDLSSEKDDSYIRMRQVSNSYNSSLYQDQENSSENIPMDDQKAFDNGR